MDAVKMLGIEVEADDGQVLVQGAGLRGLHAAYRPVECGGSGTTMRLLAGLLAGQPFYSVLTGNAQLSRRPMDRVAIPLRLMGATIMGRDDGKYAPLAIAGGGLQGISYRPPVASAQVKSALLLAGLYADSATRVVEVLPTRDHTERMLRAMGARIESAGTSVTIQPSPRLSALDIQVPGDISSAAFLLVAAAIVPGSRLVLPGVGTNPGRVGIVKTLHDMGCAIAAHDERSENGEPVANLEVTYAPLRGITIARGEVPAIIDELPILAVAATQADGVTEVRGAADLRVKETDRIATTVTELQRMGACIEALPDGFRVHGPSRLRGAMVDSHGDHRLAMALAIAGLVAEGETVVQDAACTEDSFPGFGSVLEALCLGGAQL
jgi:3-phosphoshikimate 1-carboxyvinyltransferase